MFSIRQKTVKIMFVQALTSPWIDGFFNNLTQMKTSMRSSVSRKNYIYTLENLSIWQTKKSKVKIGENYICPRNTHVAKVLPFRQQISSFYYTCM